MNPRTSDAYTNTNHSPLRPAPGLEEMLHRSSITPPSPIAVRPQQAAEMIGVSERTLRELMRQGEIPFAKLDRAVLIQVRELEAFIERRTSKGGVS